MSNKNQVYTWETGMPTKPDVDLLLKKWPDVKIGDEFLYTEIAESIGTTVRSSRFDSVVKVWKKRIREKGIVIHTRKNISYFAASAAQVCSATYGVIERSTRAYRRQRMNLSAVAAETDEERSIKNHHGLLMH